MLSMKEKTEMRPPFQFSKCIRHMEYSKNSVEIICQIIVSICKQYGNEVADKACLKAVELMEAGATEEELIKAMQEMLN